MSPELSQDVRQRLETEHCGWLTTISNSGQPVPKLVWFYFDGSDLTVYSHPHAAKVAHVFINPKVSLNLDSDGSGGGVVVIGGTARVTAELVDPREDRPYWDKFRDDAAAIGLTEAMADYSTRITITPTKVWTTPTV